MRLGQIRAACCTAFGTDPRNGSAPVSFCTMAQYQCRSGLRIRTRCGMQLAQYRSYALIFSSYVAPIRCRSVPDVECNWPSISLTHSYLVHMWPQSGADPYRVCAIPGTEHSQIVLYLTQTCAICIRPKDNSSHDDTKWH